MKLFQKLRSNMTVNTIGAIVMLLILFGAIVSTIGFLSFTKAFKNEYDISTYHMADTATSFVRGDYIDDYLAGEKVEDYKLTKMYLNNYCRTMSVSLVYVIKVDTSDYGSFVSVFNLVNNSVDDTAYTPWELGYQRQASNEEYMRKYEAIYKRESLFETVYRYQKKDGVHPHITTMVPVKNTAGDVTAILCIQRPIREMNDARRPYLRQIAVSAILLALAASGLAALYIRRNLVRPIQRASDEATRFAKENTKGEPLGSISRYEVLERLAASIDTMETDMVSYIDNLTDVTAEKERIGAELSLASTIQENSIPNKFPAFPDRKEFDIFASMDPAREVGGDFYNFFLIDDDHLALIIGDVSGKGVPAALFMMVTNILISDRMHMGGMPADTLGVTNTNLCANNKAEMFVSVWLGVLEISTGKLIAANAGHEYPALKKPGGGFELLKDKHGFVVGGMDGLKYKEYELQLEPGTKLFVYTDGVPEATDSDNRLFGTERMLAALNKSPEASPEQILKNVRDDVDGFVKDAEQFDDLTMLCLEFKG